MLKLYKQQFFITAKNNKDNIKFPRYKLLNLATNNFRKLLTVVSWLLRFLQEPVLQSNIYRILNWNLLWKIVRIPL